MHLREAPSLAVAANASGLPRKVRPKPTAPNLADTDNLAAMNQTWDSQLQSFASYKLVRKLLSRPYFTSYLARGPDRGTVEDHVMHIYDRTSPIELTEWLHRASTIEKHQHENVVPVVDLGVVDGQGYLVSPFLEARDLADVWARREKDQIPFPLEAAVCIASQLCRALLYAPHSIGDSAYPAVPAYAIMVTSDGRAMVDFGRGSLQPRNAIADPSILRYKSPEEIRGAKLNGRSSVYSVGIVLWEMLTGRSLFPAFGRTIPRREERNPDPQRRPFFGVISPGVVDPTLPEVLRAICCFALKTNPRRRFKGCEDFGAELDAFLTERGTDGVSELKAFMTTLFAVDFEQERKSRALPWPGKETSKPS